MNHQAPLTRTLIAALIAVLAAACGDAPTSPLAVPATPDLAHAAGAMDADDFEYRIIRHPEGPTRTYANAMTERGDIVGHFFDGTRWDGFRLRGGSYERISVPGSALTNANGTNERGDVVGVYNAGAGPRAFLLTGGEYQTLDAPDGYHTRAFDIAANGTIAGSYHAGTGKWQPATWVKGVFTPLPELTEALGADMAEGFGINIHGQVVGHYTVAGDIFPGTSNLKMYGFMYDNGQVRATLDYPGSGWMSCGFGIGTRGEIVGHYVDLATEEVAVSGYMWADGAYTARIVVPGAIGTYPQKVTNGGIVGYALLGGRNEQGAFFWTDAVAFVATPKRPGRR